MPLLDECGRAYPPSVTTAMVNSPCNASICTCPVLVLSTLLLGEWLGAPGWEAQLGEQAPVWVEGLLWEPMCLCPGPCGTSRTIRGARKAAPRPGHHCSLVPKFKKRPLIAKVPHIRCCIDLNIIFKSLAVLPLLSQKRTVGSHRLRDKSRGREASHRSGSCGCRPGAVSVCCAHPGSWGAPQE